jgi:PAS domain S-box-containing protein
MVWTATPDGTIEYASDRWYDYTGLTPEQNATNWAELVLHPDDYERCVREWTHALQNPPDEYLIEVRNRRQDGQYRWFQTRAVPARDEHGDVTAWYGVTTDIHDRVQAEAALRESEERSRLAIQAARACTWELNLRDQSYKLGDNFEDVVGISPDLLPRNSEEVSAMINVPEDMQAVQQIIVQAIQAGRELPPLQYRVIQPQTKEIIWLEVNAKLAYDAEGKPHRMFGMVQNITGRKAEEALLNRLLQREREQRASAEQAKAEAEQAKALAERELAERKRAEAALGVWAESPLPHEARSPGLRYGMALAVTAIAVLARYILDPLLGDELHFTALFGAIAFGVWYAGLGPALLSGILGYWFTSWLLIEPRHAFGPAAASFIGLAIYLLSGSVVISLGDAMRRAQRHAHQSARVAVERKREAEFRLEEQKRVEGALRASEQRFRDIFETAGVSVWVEDFSAVKAEIEALRAQGEQDFRAYFAEHPDFVRRAIALVRIQDVNNETLHLFGAQNKEDLLQSLSTVFGPETEPVFLEELVALAEGDETMRSEAPMRTLDGRTISVLFTMHFGPPTGDLSRVVVTLTDITMRKQMEQALSGERELLNRIIDSIPVMLTVYEPSTELLRLNRQFEQLVGWNGAEATGISLMEACYPDPNYREQVRRFMERGVENEWMDIQMQTRAGRTLETSWSNIRLSNEMQVGIGIDISERKRMEQELKHERELLERLFETMPVCVSMYYPETNSMRFNQEFERTLGWKSEEVTVASVLEALYPDPEYRGAVLQRMAAAGTNDWVEVQVQTRDGRTLDSMWSNVSIMDGERIVRGIALGIDITERKRAERSLREYARQQTALYTLADRLQRTGSPADIYDAALNAILDALQCDRASILLFDQSETLRFVAWSGLSEAYREATEGHSPWRRDEQNPQPVTMGDIETADLSDALRTTARAEGIGALAFIPLISDGELIGKFMVYFNAPHAFGEAEIGLSQTIAHQLAAAIERRRDDEALRASESLYRTIARSIPGGGVYVIDKDFRYLVAEGPVTEAFGLTREMLEGHTVSEAFPGEPAARMEDRLRRNLAGETVSFETNHNGRVYWTQQAPLLNSLGQVIVVTLDITERKRAEEALRQSEERFARFMQNLPGLAWIKDAQGRYMYANAAAEKAFQTPREQLYGRTDEEVFLPEVAAQFKKNDERALQEAQGIQVIEELQQDDGVLHYSLVTKFPIPGSDGEIALIGGTAFDITERKQAEEALKMAHTRAEETADRMARLQQVTASLARAATPAQLAEMILEQGTRATGATAGLLARLVSDGLELQTMAALGYPPAAVRTEPVPLSAATPMSDCILTKQAIWLGSHEEFVTHYPALAEARRGFGNEATVALPLMVGERVLGGLAFSFREVREFGLEERGFFLAVAQQCAQGLERVLASEALRESEERYRALVNQATAGIVRKDPNGKILFVNQAFCEMLGYPASELLDKTMWQLTHDDDVSENRRLYSRLMAEGTPFELEKRLLHRDGSVLWATVSVSPVMDSSGKPQSAVSVYADITERKQVEADLSESRERFRNLFNLVPVAVYSCDADGLIQEYNRSAIELWGREPLRNDPSERYCGSFKLYYPDGRFMPHRSCPMARMLRGETLAPSELEILVERTDGARRNVIAHPLPLRNERGKITGAINCLYDITDRKQAESRLALLVEVSELARQFEDPLELMAAVSDAVGSHFHVRRCLFNEINLEEDLEIVHHDYHDGIESVVGVHKLSDYSSAATAEIMSGQTIVNHDSKTDTRTADDYVRSYLPTGERAYIAVPLLRDDRWAATLWISDDAPRQWSQAEVSLLEAVAERTWTAAEKLRIHAELRDSEERLRVTFNTTAVGFATLSPDLRFIEVNEAYSAITGYEREALTRIDYYALIHPAYKAETREQVARLIAGEIPAVILEKICIRRDGAEIWVQNDLSLVRDADGDPLHLIVICQDVTERKQAEAAMQRLNTELEQLNVELEQRVVMRTAELSATNAHLLDEIEERAMAEEALRESDATTRLILDTSPDAIVITNRQGRIMRVNAQIENLFGYQPTEALGQMIESLIPERFHQHHLKHRAYYNQNPHRRPMGMGLELSGRRKNGTEFPVDVTLTPIQNQNIADWDTMVTIRDSTERKRMEAELRESHKRLQMLSQRLVEVQEDERRAIARELHDRVGQSLAALSLNLTIASNELSGLVDEQMNLRLTDSRQLATEVIALVRDVMADLRPAVLDDYGLEAALNTSLEKFRERFGIDIRFEKNQSLMPRFNPSIEMTLLRIAQEAIANAGRHAQADRIDLSLQLEADRIRLHVEDNGTGIQSWEQANRPGSHGLVIMRERAEAVGGTFEVSSAPGQGTKIEVSIPVQHQSPKE